MHISAKALTKIVYIDVDIALKPEQKYFNESKTWACIGKILNAEKTVLERSQIDLEVWCSETLPDASSILGNLAG